MKSNDRLVLVEVNFDKEAGQLLPMTTTWMKANNPFLTLIKWCLQFTMLINDLLLFHIKTCF